MSITFKCDLFEYLFVSDFPLMLHPLFLYLCEFVSQLLAHALSSPLQ